MMNQINIVKHLFQIALTNEFNIPVVVNIGQVYSKPELIMVQQTTLDEWSNDFNTTGPVPIMWVQIKVYLPPTVTRDAESLTDTYIEMRNNIIKKMKLGRAFNESSF